MTFATGYIPDPVGHRRTPFQRFAARLAAAPPAEASLEPYLPAVFDQGQTGSCTGHATSAGLYAACGYAAAVLGLIAALAFVPSPDGIYKLGRCVDRVPNVDGSLPPLTDDGAQPNQVMRGVSEWGVKPLKAPTPDGRYSDAVPPSPPDSATGVNAEPSLADIEADAQTVLVGEYGIYSSGTQRSNEVASAIAAGAPVCAAVPGGSSAWQNYSSGVLSATGEPLDHYIVIVAYKTLSSGKRVFKIRNSWGDWGESGDCWVDEAALDEMGDLFAMTVRRAA